MSDFRFACPNCGQRIIVDSTHRGREITCPDCQKLLTIPQIRAPAPGTGSNAGTSKLALASLVCSMLLGMGCVPGIVFGHLAQVRLRRNPSLQGKRMATAGLIISYASLLLTAAFLAYGFIVFAPRLGRQLTGEEKAANTPAVMAPRLVDQVVIGNRDSEISHGLRGRLSRSGPFMEKTWRDSAFGGSFSYDLKVDPVQPMSLFCTYWGNDSEPGRRFDVLVNEKVIATQTLNFNDPGHYFDVEYKIPRNLTRGTNQVTVTFQAYPNQMAGGVFGVQMVKR